MPPKKAEWKDQHKQISTDAEYTAAINYKGLTVMEVHAGWCGPCECLVPTLKQLHWELKEERQSGLEFVAANSDEIEALKEYKFRSKPLFLFFRKGQRVGEVDGVSTHLLKSFVEENAPSKGDLQGDD